MNDFAFGGMGRDKKEKQNEKMQKSVHSEKDA